MGFLKKYKINPKISRQEELSKLFDDLFNKKYKSSSSNDLLSHTRSRKEGLLLVLKYPFIPLHNNDSERDTREYVKNEKYQETLVAMKEDKQETHSQV